VVSGERRRPLVVGAVLGVLAPGSTVDVLAVMGLGATAGTTLVITADGPDADVDVQSLADVLATAE
jgi:phosphotransferase system HPr-like phosphotransfer protein